MVNIVKALGSLDPENSEHWTAGGLPRVEAVQAKLLEDDPFAEVDGVKRADITEKWPDFNLETAQAQLAAAKSEAEAEVAMDKESEPEEDKEPEPEPKENKEPETSAEVVAATLAVSEGKRDELRIKLNEELSGLNERRAKIVEAREEATKALDSVDGEIVDLQDRIDGEVGKIPLATALRSYIDASQRERAQRVGRFQTLVGAGVVASSKAPVDASRVVNRRHGSKLRVRSPLNLG